MDDLTVASALLLLSCLAVVVVVRHKQVKRLKLKKPRKWVRSWLGRRMDYGFFDNLMRELEAEDIPSYKNFLRMYPAEFNELVNKVSPLIQKRNTNMRQCIPPDLRLALTLRFMATGDSYVSHQYSFRVAANTIGKIVPETCMAIYTVLKDEYFNCPKSPDSWKAVANGFWERWNFPNTIGALDGKHIVIQKPINTGSKFFNYKGSFSVVLMAVADFNYKFLYISVGTQGRISDGGTFGATKLKAAIEANTLNIPASAPLPGTNTNVPYFLVGDEAFPLRHYLMKPYPSRNLSHAERIFNYRICRARRIIENAFGILASRFRVFLRPIMVDPIKVDKIVLAACSLHNMLRTKYPGATDATVDIEDPVTHQIIPGTWRTDAIMQPVNVLRGNNATRLAKNQRDTLRDFVNSQIGSVSWQEDMI